MKTTIAKYLTPLMIACTVVGTSTLAACAGSPTKESTGEHVDDAWITTKIKSEFVATKGVKGRDISVETFKGVVQLAGFSDSRDEIQRAGEIARGVKGVVSVKNDIRLKTAG